MSISGKLPRAGLQLRTRALAYPEAYEELPWGHHAIKVNGKAFLFLGAEDGGFSMSTKLPGSAAVALALPFASPTAYGLGKSGWVTAEFGPNAKVPVALLETWIDESYRAIAPKRCSRSWIRRRLGAPGRRSAVRRPRLPGAAEI
jgi:predicted DNA-binding protein (MmcQ/YjbR family)